MLRKTVHVSRSVRMVSSRFSPKPSSAPPWRHRGNFGWAMVTLGLGLWVFSSAATTPVAWWKFDDATHLGLDSVGGNNAALMGNPVPVAGPGHSGSAISLNGNGQYLLVADSPSLDITGPMTVVVWAKANAVNGNYPFLYKATSWDDGQMAYTLDLNWFTGGYYPRFTVTSDGHATGYVQVSSPDALTTGDWHLIAGVYDGAYIRVYVDGQLKASTPETAGIFPGHDPLYIGWNWNATWNGSLDELRIYNVALSAAEILAIYQDQSLPPLNASPSGAFGLVAVGQTATNQVTFTNMGTNDLNVDPLQLSGPDASRFEVLAPAGGFVLHPGASNAVIGLVIFAPDSARAFSAMLTANSSTNTAQVPLTGQGVNSKTFGLKLQTRDASGQVIVTPQTFNGSQMAILIIDVWDSHDDPEMSSRTAGMIPRMNQALDAARDLGIQVIFCPNEVPLPAGADRSVFATLPNQPQIDNGFNPTLPPYADSAWGDMVPIPYDVAHAPRFNHWSSQHPDLVVKPGDLASVSRQEIFNYCVANGITHLLYMGSAANMCLASTREISMLWMKRYCGLEPIQLRDLTDSMTLNGRIATGNNDSNSNIDPNMTPDYGHRLVTASNEKSLCSSIDARQLMQYWPSAGYADLVSGDSNLLCYWRLDSKNGYQEILDIRRLQSCWWNRNDARQTAGLSFGVPGAIANDPDTAVQFGGASTLLISPIYRVDIPGNIPLASLSSTNFTLELWVKISQLNGSNQWFYAHDDGTAGGVDVLLGLSSSNRFEFVVGRNPAGTDFGDVVTSTNTVSQADVDSQRWFYLVAEHDRDHGNVALYVDANGPAVAPDNCASVSLTSAPHLGSRGVAQMGADGNLSSLGFEGLTGVLDDVAVYSTALDSATIRTHHAAAKGIYSPPQFTSIALAADRSAQLSFAGTIGRTYLFQSSTNLVGWDSMITNIAPAGGLEFLDPGATNCPNRFYRAIQLP